VRRWRGSGEGCFKRKIQLNYGSYFRLWDSGKSQHAQNGKKGEKFEIKTTYFLNINRMVKF
jgi:hypothetical protein